MGETMGEWQMRRFMWPTPISVIDGGESPSDAPLPPEYEAEYNAATHQWRAPVAYPPGAYRIIAGEVVAKDPAYAAALMHGIVEPGDVLTEHGRRLLPRLLTYPRQLRLPRWLDRALEEDDEF